MRVWREMEEFDSSGAGAHPNWPERFFARLVDTYLRQTDHSADQVGDARAFLLDSRGLLAFALGVMKALATDASTETALDA
jgi:aminoglycoside 3-N-acetyltransferase